jgi:Cytidine and deoxycytidylate deaminase zinc-binding region
LAFIVSVEYYFQLAAATACQRKDRRSFLLGSVGVRSDGVIVRSYNSPSEIPNRTAHSEWRLAKKLDYGATVYVARIKLIDGSFGMARPCASCMKMLRTKQVRRVYYTINENEYDFVTP